MTERINWRAGEQIAPLLAKRVPIGWQPWEIELVRGAMEEADTRRAIADCSQMLSRSYAAIETKMGEERRASGIHRYMPKVKASMPIPKIAMPVRLESQPERIMLPKAVAAYVSDFIKPLTAEQKMCGRASPRRQRVAIA